jgi:Rps23 Pro-64 3,4-dihydroxylase Tpa1-like proline 4-hydroxylase
MQPSYFYFDKNELSKRAKERHDAYINAQPFPHTVIDDFVSTEVLDQVRAEFPEAHHIDWNSFPDDVRQNRKLSCEDETQMGPVTRHLLTQFNSSTFISFLEELTGIPSLIGDPHFRGGGLHQTLRGGSLGMHADFNYYKKLKVYRRINLILYLNKDWKEEYGGHLELWDTSMTTCVERVLPIFNRAVIFNTDNFSNHGQPDPLMCKEDDSRKSLALYYYTVDSPTKKAEAPHTTLFRQRPGKDEGFKEYNSDLMSRVVRKIKKLVGAFMSTK